MIRRAAFLAAIVVAAVLILRLNASNEIARLTDTEIASSTPDSSFQGAESPESISSGDLANSQVEPETTQTVLAPEQDAISPESAPPDEQNYQVDRPNPFDLRSEFANEIVDIEWALMAESDIRDHLFDVLAARLEFGERYALTSVSCRSTLCEAVFTDYDNHQDSGPSIFQGNLHMTDLELRDQPRFAEFNFLESKMLYMPSGGVLEQRLYLRRADPDSPQN